VINGLIDNSYRVGVCPFCASERVVSVGPIQYASPAPFASHIVLLARTPELWRCRRCLSGYVENVIPPREALGLYEAGDSAGRWEALSFETDKTRLLVDFVSGLLKPGAAVLDFGCNDGVLLDFLKKQGAGWTFGVEASVAARSLAEAKGHVIRHTLDALTEQPLFDIVFAMDVVEHLYDIPAFLSQIAKRLTPGGILVFLTGNVNSLTARMASNNWWYLRYAEHVRFPSLKWLRRHTEFRVVKVARVHASQGYVHPLSVASVKSALERWKQNEYDGMPVLLPDHYAVALRVEKRLRDE
jgi:2-polyprenyl-3-methyl-5-hydroxy-6-metoxy-1,4-benzoquinol methylase